MGNTLPKRQLEAQVFPGRIEISLLPVEWGFRGWCNCILSPICNCGVKLCMYASDCCNNQIDLGYLLVFDKNTDTFTQTRYNLLRTVDDFSCQLSIINGVAYEERKVFGTQGLTRSYLLLSFSDGTALKDQPVYVSETRESLISIDLVQKFLGLGADACQPRNMLAAELERQTESKQYDSGSINLARLNVANQCETTPGYARMVGEI